jgi:hypothetical protein
VGGQEESVVNSTTGEFPLLTQAFSRRTSGGWLPSMMLMGNGALRISTRLTKNDFGAWLHIARLVIQTSEMGCLHDGPPADRHYT